VLEPPSTSEKKSTSPPAFDAGAKTVPPNMPLKVPPIGVGSPLPLPGLPLPPPPPQPIAIACRLWS
jgi:hypothetical protein